jgi:protein O-mannosyl-transferase
MTAPSPLRDVRAAAVVVGLLAALVYANSLRNGFAYDDVHIIVNNRAIQSLETLPGALTQPYWPDVYGRELGLWRPLTTGVFGLMHVVGGGSPLVFHAANVLAHAAASVLVLLLCAALMPLLPSLLAGLLFAVHPVHVEAVANAVGLAELLSAVVMLTACLVHVRGPERSGWGHAFTLGALYAVAFGVKESGVTLPALIFLVDAARRRVALDDLGAYVRDRWRPYLLMAVVAAAMLAGRYAVLRSIANPFAPVGADLLTEIPRIWTLGEVWTHYVRLWVFPLDLAADYAPNVIPVSFGWHAANTLGVGLALCVLLASLILWRKPELRPDALTARAAAFGVVWFVIAISPTSNVLFLSGVLLAERTLYLPSVGLAAATGWLVVRLARERPRVAWVALVLALTFGAVRTWTRTPVWRDNQTFFLTMLRELPHAGRSQWILGDQFISVGSLSQGLVAYRAAVDILGGHYTVVTRIAERLMTAGEYDAAERLLTLAWRDAPHFPFASGLLAWIRADQGDAPGTEEWARRSLALHDPDPTRWYLLSWALAAQGEWDEARRARERAEELGVVRVWHRWMYTAYARREAADTPGAHAAVDSAWADATTGQGRRAIDSVRVADFGLEPLGRGTAEGSRDGAARPSAPEGSGASPDPADG